MRIIKLDREQVPDDFLPSNQLSMTTKELAPLHQEFEQDIVKALQRIQDDQSENELFELIAGIPIRTVSTSGLWQTGYEERIEVIEGDQVLGGTIFIWIAWSSIDLFRTNNGSSYHPTHQQFELLSQISAYWLYKNYKQLKGDKVVQLAQYIYTVGVVEGMRKRIKKLDRNAADHYSKFQAASERRRVLLGFIDPFK